MPKRRRKDPRNDPASDEYVAPWRRPMPEPLNHHLTQLRPRRDERNPALDELIERERNKPRRPRSNLLR